MSEHKAKVIKIRKVEAHPNADKLQIIPIWDYTTCVRAGDFKIGDLGVFIEPDTLIPVSQPEFSFLAGQDEDGFVRIRARRLRGISSFGLLIKARPEWREGDDVFEELGCKHWDPPPSGDGLDAPAPSVYSVKYDVENLRRFNNIIQEGELVEITEKINGENSRFVWADNELHASSHTRWKIQDDRIPWWKVAKKLALATKLQKYSNYVFYGELYGGVKHFPYGLPRGERDLIFFDILNKDEWLPPLVTRQICKELELNYAPLFYEGPWSDDCKKFADGSSALDKHIREGCVVKPLVPRRDPECGRVILKLVSIDYLEGKKK
jgi:RNA ligase (TIGR02306 family)